MEIEEKLIYFVQRYECLYNVASKHYSDRNAKNNAWDKISQKLGLSALDCQKRWKKIRDSYRRSLNLRKDGKSGSARIRPKPIKFEKELEFLKKYIVLENSQVSNLDESSAYSINDDSQSIQSPIQANSPASRPGSVSRSPSHTPNISQQPRASEILSRYIEAKKKEDCTDYFFKSMASKVKGMPNKIKAEIERKIFQIVNDAELKLIEQEELNLLYSSRGENAMTHTPSSVDNIQTKAINAPVANYQTGKNNNPANKNVTYTPSNISNFQAARRSAPYTYTPSSVSNDRTEITDAPLPNYETDENYNFTDKNVPLSMSNFQAARVSAPYTYTPSSVSNDRTEITDAPLPNYETDENYNFTDKNVPSNMSNFQAARMSAPYTYTPSSVSNDETVITDTPFTNYENQTPSP